MEKDNKNIICGGGNVVAREEKAIRVLVSTVYWLSPAAIRLFPFLCWAAGSKRSEAEVERDCEEEIL